MIFAYFICIAWGIMYYLMSRLTKLGLSYGGFTIILLPITISMIIYGFYHNDYENDLKLLNKNNIILIISFIFSSFAGNVLVFLSMKTVDPFTVSILEIGYPIVILIIMILMNEVKFNMIHLLGIFFTFLGIFLILKES
jgi:drug/metabolite transporter (DMT)-like permease